MELILDAATDRVACFLRFHEIGLKFANFSFFIALPHCECEVSVPETAIAPRLKKIFLISEIVLAVLLLERRWRQQCMLVRRSTSPTCCPHRCGKCGHMTWIVESSFANQCLPQQLPRRLEVLQKHASLQSSAPMSWPQLKCKKIR